MVGCYVLATICVLGCAQGLPGTLVERQAPSSTKAYCSSTPKATPPVGDVCGKGGSLTKPKPEGPASGNYDAAGCAMFCNSHPRCMSFSLTGAGLCQLYSKSISKQGYTAKKPTGANYYDITCYGPVYSDLFINPGFIAKETGSLSPNWQILSSRGCNATISTFAETGKYSAKVQTEINDYALVPNVGFVQRSRDDSGDLKLCPGKKYTAHFSYFRTHRNIGQILLAVFPAKGEGRLLYSAETKGPGGTWEKVSRGFTASDVQNEILLEIEANGNYTFYIDNFYITLDD